MGVSLVVGLVLGGVGATLGVANFVYWAWWERRQVVKLQMAHVNAEAIEELRSDESHTRRQIERIFVSASFELRQTSGHKNTYIRACHLQLDRQLCSDLAEWFDIPSDGKIEKPAADVVDFTPSESLDGLERKQDFVELTNKPRKFSLSESIPRNQGLVDLYSSSAAQTVQEVEEIKRKVHQLKTRCTMGYTCGDGKVRNWRFR